VLALGGVSVVAMNLFQVWTPWLVRQAVDHVQQSAPRDTLVADAWLILLAVLLQGVFLYMMRMTLIRTSRLMEYELRNDLFDHLARLPAHIYRTRKVGDLMSRATNDLDAVRDLLGPGLMYFSTTAATLVMVVTLMCRIDWSLTLLALVPLPIVSLLMARLGGRMYQTYEAIQAAFAAVTAKAQETLAVIRVVKAHVEEEGQLRGFRDLHDDYTEKNRAMIRIMSAMWPSLSLLGGLSLAIVLWAGGTAVVSGRITLGELVAFQIYLGMLLWPMIAFGWVANLFQRAAASMGRIREVMDLEAENDVARATVAPAAGASRDHAEHAAGSTVELHGVGYRYPGTERMVLRGVDLALKPGEAVAIVGRTGSGKTTLLNLIGGLDLPTGGFVEVGGVRISDLSGGRLSRWRSEHIGFVFQLYNLLPVLTAERNVELPLLLTSLSRKERRQRASIALKIVGLADRARHYPRQLSGGQEQRVGIARAIVTDPTLLLCDEPTGDLDRKSGDEVLDLLQALNKQHGKTIVMVTHDPRAAERANRVLHLEKGRLEREVK
jgi:ABC-type multidrug transport system fused ATPase/permease subunit